MNLKRINHYNFPLFKTLPLGSSPSNKAISECRNSAAANLLYSSKFETFGRVNH
jgi:hypothetical protein